MFCLTIWCILSCFILVNKSKDSPVDTAKKKAELEKRLQDVSGQLSGTKSKSKKNAGKYKYCTLGTS